MDETTLLCLSIGSVVIGAILLIVGACLYADEENLLWPYLCFLGAFIFIAVLPMEIYPDFSHRDDSWAYIGWILWIIWKFQFLGAFAFAAVCIIGIIDALGTKRQVTWTGRKTASGAFRQWREAIILMAVTAVFVGFGIFALLRALPKQNPAFVKLVAAVKRYNKAYGSSIKAKAEPFEIAIPGSFFDNDPDAKTDLSSAVVDAFKDRGGKGTLKVEKIVEVQYYSESKKNNEIDAHVVVFDGTLEIAGTPKKCLTSEPMDFLKPAGEEETNEWAKRWTTYFNTRARAVGSGQALPLPRPGQKKGAKGVLINPPTF